MNPKDIDALTSRALLYKLISTGIDYPTQKLLDALSTDEYYEGFDDVLAPLGGQLKEITSAFREKLLAESRQTDLESFEIEYNRIFQISHVDACPLTASQYMKGESRQAMAVAQLRGLYKNFGVNTVPLREPDHLSSLCEFMSLLCAKELHAQKSGVMQRVDDCVTAQTIVIEDYLSFVPLLQKAIANHTRKHFYLWISAITVEFIALERDQFLLTSAKAN
ncbi:MAG: molecular chaperone TorD family protein [Candidatus Melainabacteria bacterium]|jgi:TorA maturation chaperone TorD|nr:molecular chaperone TorD family protein [Candidatus Melainabacteria bacterium]